MDTNRAHFADGFSQRRVAAELLDVCFDPQTSGGLLASVDAAHVEAILAELGAMRRSCGSRVGDAIARLPAATLS